MLILGVRHFIRRPFLLENEAVVSGRPLPGDARKAHVHVYAKVERRKGKSRQPVRTQSAGTCARATTTVQDLK